MGHVNICRLQQFDQVFNLEDIDMLFTIMAGNDDQYAILHLCDGGIAVAALTAEWLVLHYASVLYFPRAKRRSLECERWGEMVIPSVVNATVLSISVAMLLWWNSLTDQRITPP
jgi:hypothetical protein